MSRREELETMLKDSPNDTFLRYALAIELDNESEHHRSMDLHRSLMTDTPAYVPSFFMLGQQLVRLDREEEAKEVLQQGITAAQLQENLHAMAEMTEFLESLG